MVVIDTSVAYKWFSSKEEEFLPQALNLLADHLNKRQTLIAPDLIIYELANAWATKTKLHLDQIQTFIEDFAETGVKIEPITLELINKAVEFAKKYHVSVYDASYAVLAKEKNCDFITSDSKFVDRVHLPFIKHLSHYHT